MKKVLLGLGLAFALTSEGFALNAEVAQLNSEIGNLLLPLQSSTMAITMQFNELQNDASHALNFSVKGWYRKRVGDKSLQIKLDEFAYHYGDGTAPVAVISGSTRMDLTKIFSQGTLNVIMPMFEVLIQQGHSPGFDLDATGEDVTYQGIITSKTRDGYGNYTGMKWISTLHPKPADDKKSFGREIVLAGELDVKKGLKIQAYMLTNPQYEGYEAELGLKSVIDKLLAHNTELLTKLVEAIKHFDAELESKLEHAN